MDISLRQLRCFLAVADTLHFGRAAQQLYLSQPMVSHEVQRLERTLGVGLFDRTSRTVRLSDAGRRLIPLAKAALGGVTALEVAAGRLRLEQAGHFKIAATPSVMNEVIPRLLRAAEKLAPGVTLEEVEVETGAVGSALESGQADIGLGRYVQTSADFAHEVVCHDPVVATLSATDPRAAASTVELGTMGDTPLLLWPREQNPAYYDALLEICAADGLDPLVIVSRPRIIGARSYLIADGRAFGLLPAPSAASLSPGVRAVPLRSGARLPLEMCWGRTDPRPVLPDVLDLIRKVVAGGRSGLR